MPAARRGKNEMSARGTAPVNGPADERAEPAGGLKPGDLAEVVAGEAAHGGWCVGRLSGRVVFIRHALPGERVRIRITEVTARLARAEAVEILGPSPDRVEPPCPYARPGACGGCDWQHASLPAQRALKASVVSQQLRRIAGIDWPVRVEALPGDEDGRDGPAGLGWRTRVKFAVGRDGAAGLRAHRSHRVVEVDDCLIAHPGIRELGVTSHRWPGAKSVEGVVATGSRERAVIVSGGNRSAYIEGIGAESVLAAARPGGRPAVLRGRSYLHQHAAGRDWRVSAGAFWQVHPAAADTLAGAVLGALRPRAGDTVLDLYCGAGLFAGVLAEAVGESGTVTGVEADSATVRDARRNLRDTPWATVYQGDAAEVIARHDLPAARLTVLDPPRTGAAREVVDYLARPVPGGSSGERRVAYVSCDPATLARDIAAFLGHGWRLEDLRAFDAFPMTHHVECLATLVSPDESVRGSAAGG
jgi:tRNA/tmRNA/rRNA uracil-C5-methylase (TrmA/RlmC/RlmD family)